MTGGRTISWLLIPPVIYGIFFGLGVLLDRAVPWSPGWLEDELDRMVFVIAGVSLEVISISYLTWRRTTVIPHGSPSYLVPRGAVLDFTQSDVHRTLQRLTLAVLSCLPPIWPLVLLILPLMILDRVIIPFEEARLKAAFRDLMTTTTGVSVDGCRSVRSSMQPPYTGGSRSRNGSICAPDSGRCRGPQLRGMSWI